MRADLALPDDLPHAAGTSNFDAVKRWFYDTGRRLFDKGNRQETQPILDHALAWAVLNEDYEIADLLLAHGADINTRCSSYEPEPHREDGVTPAAHGL